MLKAPFPWSGSRELNRLKQSDYALWWAIKSVLLGVLKVDQDGLVWRCKFKTHGVWKDCTPRRAENIGGKGYFRLTLTSPSGRQVMTMAHKLVWAWFNGPIPKEQINHDNLNKADNHPDNLIPATPEENIQHSYANGRVRPWSFATEWRPGIPRTSKEKILLIQQQYKAGMSLNALSALHSLSVNRIRRYARQGGVE
jgi:hypothetical protein